MTRRRAIRVVATGARLLTGAVVAAACVAGVTAAVAAPWPVVATAPAQVEAVPSGGDTTLVCHGPFRALGRNAADAQQVSVAGDTELTVDGTGDATQARLQPLDIFAAAEGAAVFVDDPERGENPAAAESIAFSDDRLAGLAAAPCREPAIESWLVGGTVDVGTSDIIVLANPGDVTATVTLTVYGLEDTRSEVILPAGAQRSVPLASIAAGAQEPIVRVTAAGAPVRAVLQSSLVRTLDPAGVDLQDSAGTPSSDLVFAGVRVVADRTGQSTAVLRVMATDADTEATVTVRSERGEEIQELSVPLQAETPAEVGLEGLKAGTYRVDVGADASLVGAVRQTTGVGAGTDFAWMAAAPEVDGEVRFAVPEGPGPGLHLVNTTAAEVTATVTAPGADGTEIVLPAGAGRLVRVDAGSVYTLTTDGAVHAAVGLAGDGELAGWPLWPGPDAQPPIVVYP